MSEKEKKVRHENAQLKVWQGGGPGVAAQRRLVAATGLGGGCAHRPLGCGSANCSLFPLTQRCSLRVSLAHLPPCPTLLPQEKCSLLERLDFESVQESECRKVFTRYRVAETY